MPSNNSFTLIKDGAIADDNCLLVDKEADFPDSDIAAGKAVILPLQQWLDNREQLQSQQHIGVWLDSDEPPEPLAEHCLSIPLIAINFPVFTDGRGYSYARQLRDHFGYTGELRAIGDVLLDQLNFYQRCGFNSFALCAKLDAEKALHSLKGFSANYQSTNEKEAPLFRKRQN